MAHVIQEERIVQDGGPGDVAQSTGNIIARVIYTISGIITGLLAIRFILSLLGANPSNPFANFIYNLSQPLVAPFFGLFNYQVRYGVARFEFETLIALAVFSFVAWILVRIANGGRSEVTG